MVVERLLVIIYIALVGIPSEKVLGELQHVVGVAGFGCRSTQPVVQFSGCTEMLAVAVSTVDVSVVPDNCFPEERRYDRIPLASGYLVHACTTHHLGHLSIGMQSLKTVNAVCQRFHYSLMIIETLGHCQKFRFAGNGIQIGQGFVHASIFACKHRLHFFFVKPVKRVIKKVSQT